MNKNKILHIVVTSTVLFGGSLAITPYASAAVAEVERTVNFREEPSVDGDQIRYLRTGEKVSILERVNSYWLKVKDSRGTVGYVSSSSKYVDIQDGSGTTASSGSAAIAVVERTVNFREEPSVDGDQIRYLRTGEKVSILEKVNSYWLKVKDSKGKVGYVSSSSKYIDIKGNVETSETKPTETKPNGTKPSASVQKVINAGMKYLGTPYEFGSSRSNTRTFDCSDFVRQAYKDGAGITLTSNSRTQADYVRSIGKTTTDWRDLKPGDIMFFMSYEGSDETDYEGINKSGQRITHNAIYLGDGKILQTYSKDSGGVRIDTIGDDHWEYRFIFGGSVL
ncbi:NlpC/P60 family protein [Paenibacillus antri]|uniref:NlpC/P60 family protein n=1 Tax=Paenibacillus antri TaxID=2582848 RepID=A0A5R9G108_9BACL|nr:C40 family peptidase [Paenibacillus antri]TLS50012.1 NlpC/P60 family protein [Paenibacillus antri]